MGTSQQLNHNSEPTLCVAEVEGEVKRADSLLSWLLTTSGTAAFHQKMH
jgi:hypothetical protein